jgi:hypothetical protein
VESVARWECALQCALIWTGLVAAFLIVSSHTYLAIERLLGLKTFVLMWTGGGATMFATWAAIRYAWTDLLGLPYPMPLIGLVNFVAGFVAELLILFFQFPREWRRDGEFRRQLLLLMATQLCLIVIFLAYFG